MSESFKEIFEESLKNTEMRIGKIIQANVISVEREFVWLDAGLKSESIVPLEQFKNSEGKLDVEKGDKVDVVLESLENDFGSTCLSREKAKRIEIWNELERASKENESICGRITNHVRGGYTVEVKNLRAFLPGSLVDIRPIRDISHLENKEIEFKIVKLDQLRNNIVVSRKAVIEAETKEDRETLFARLSEGNIMEGVVKNITDFGAFIDLGGIDGLLHITDISWSRIKHPSNILNLGDTVKVKIIKCDNEKNRISLGMKQLEEDPWKNIVEELPLNTKLTGKVTNITDYGCFAKIKEGIEGLIHNSEMDWTNKNINPHKVVSLNEEIEVMILEIDAPRHRISLGMKQCKVNPWKAFAEKYTKNDKVTGKIRSITDFGVFVGLDGKIDGLIHISDVDWNKPEEKIKNLKKGDSIESVVLSVDIERERIALSTKKLFEDPLEKYLTLHQKKEKIKGEIINIKSNGAVVKFSEGIEGFLRFYDNQVEKKDFKCGEKIECYISNIDSKRRSLQLTKDLKDSYHTKKFDKRSTESKIKNERIIPTTIGDLIKAKLKK